MPWRVVVEALPGAAPVEATPLEVEATSWVVALRTARELLGFPPPDPRQLSVEVRDSLWRVADRTLGRLFIVESLKPPSVQMPVPDLAPPPPPDIACEVRVRLPRTEERGFEYIEELLVAPRLESLEVAHTWLKLRLAAWRNFRSESSPHLLLRLFCFAEAPRSSEAEPVASVEFRSWSRAVDYQPPHESLAAVASGAHQIPSSPAILAALASVATPQPVAASLPTPVDLALVAAVVPPPAAANSQADLIGTIFDSVHDVHFAPTLLDGADLLCDIAYRNIPCNGAFIFLHDMNTAGWILAAGAGEGAARLFGERLPAGDPLLARIGQRGVGLRVSGEACVHTLNAGARPGHALLASAAVGGRLYGVIELVVAAGGEPFTDEQEHALAYLAEQFATFAASRGILIRENEIVARRRA
jgi:hypothetical protein